MSVTICGCAVPSNVAMDETRAGWRTAFGAEAFAREAGRVDVPMFVNHLSGRDITSTLRLHSAPHGLFFAGRIDHSDWAAIVLAAQQNRRLFGASIAWADDVGTKYQSSRLYVITSARLLEISLMIGKQPAFSGTWVTIERAAVAA